MERGRLFVISGPSGVGKGTLLNMLFADLKDLAKSVSATTRDPRPGERDGVEYYFLTREQFEERIPKNLFLEHAEYSGNFYGTPRDKVEAQRAIGLDVILEIEVQGAMQVKQSLPEAILLYIRPPALQELERRLRDRRTETEERIQSRLAIALDELEFIPRYDYLITNDNLDEAFDVLRSIVIAERHRVTS